MKIGIITIHKIPNYGSALQAYALQHYIQTTTNNEVELIDYIYPNKYHYKQETFVKRIKRVGRTFINKIKPNQIQKKKAFHAFYNKYFNLSSTQYNIKKIYSAPPIYDIYITGSDQVWNLNTLHNDPTMFCTFAPLGSKKIAFSASFTTQSLPTPYKAEIQKRLLDYSFIGVREASSLKILQQLKLRSDIIQKCTCDPTLLLSANDYDKLVNDSKIKIEDQYILIYSLGYAFIPEPAISIIAELATKHYNCKVIFLGDCSISYKCDYIIPNNIGPCEFIYLIKHARFIITSSFHGTIFSIIYRKNFISILPEKGSNDCRIKDTLSLLGLQSYGIESNNIQPNINFTYPFTVNIENKLNNYIDESKRFLKQALNSQQ